MSLWPIIVDFGVNVFLPLLHLNGINISKASFKAALCPSFCFLSAMNIIIEYVCEGEEMSEISLKAFMDDLTLLSSTMEKMKMLLKKCVEVLEWACMSFKAPKSRSMVIENGVLIKESVFFVRSQGSSELIPSIHLKPIKFLGRVISASLNDVDSSDNFFKAIVNGILAIDRQLFFEG